MKSSTMTESKSVETCFVSLCDDGTVTIVNRTWGQALLDKLNEMRINDLFCDVILQVSDGDGGEDKCSFSAHACVLAASSKLMNSILDPKPRSRFVAMKTINKQVLSHSLNYMYGQEIVVKREHIKELTKAAQMLQINSLEDQCIEAQEAMRMCSDYIEPDLQSNDPDVGFSVQDDFDGNDDGFEALDTEIPLLEKQESSGAAETTTSVDITDATSVNKVVKELLSSVKDESKNTIKLIVRDPGSAAVLEKSEDKQFLCHHCGKNFFDKDRLQLHLDRIAKNASKPVMSAEEKKRKRREWDLKRKNREYKCQHCDKVFIGYDKMYDHRIKMHTDQIPDKGRKRLLDRNKKMRCHHCGQMFTGLHGLEGHLKRVAANPNFTFKTFDKDLQKMKRRASIKAIRNRTYECADCHEKFHGWANWYKHKKLVHDRTYVCRFCSKAFTVPGQLKVHEQRHKKEKDFQCRHCDYACVTKQEIDEHVRTHHLNERHICQKCAKVFKSRSALRKHERRMHTLTIEQCRYCDYTGTSINLKNHELNKHFPDRRKLVQCRICNKTFTYKSHLDRHLLKVHQVQPTRRPGYRTNKGNDQLESHDEIFTAAARATPSRPRAVRRGKKTRALEVVEEYPEDDMLLIQDTTSLYHLDGVRSQAQISHAGVHSTAQLYF